MIEGQSMSDLRKAAEQVLNTWDTEDWFDADALRAALAQPEQEPVAVVAMDVSGVHMSYGGQYLGQKPDTKIAMLLKDLPVGTHLYVAVGMGVSNE